VVLKQLLILIIVSEHSIHNFLYSVFEKFDDTNRISIKEDDINNIISDLTIENYKKFLIKQDAKKYNL